MNCYICVVFILFLSEIFELEVNENVQLAVSDRQMPKVEYMEIKIDDYSKSVCLSFFLMLLL